MMKVTEMGKRILLTGMVVTAMITATASSMLGAQAVSTDDNMEHMGLVEAMPDGGTVGIWVIGGETFNADENTEFDTEEGPLEVDACAEVEYETTADGNLALEIESDDSPDCIDDEDSDDEDSEDSEDSENEDSEDEESMEQMGLVEAMPDGGTVGSWVIGGETFNANENTEFKTNKGPLEIGACAEVEYEAAADGNLALEIKGDDSSDCMDTEDEADGDADSTADPVDSTTPANSVGGNAVDTGAPILLISNSVDAAPNQVPPPGDGGTGTEAPNAPEDEAAEDETAEDEAAEDEADEADDADDADETEDEGEEVYGIVDVMPAGADMPMGTWVIDGVNYVATADTEVEEEHGPFEIGTHVGLEFQVVDGVNQLMELETEPAPGAGPNTIAGMIESKGGGAIVAASAAANATWVIGGTEYTIVSITEMDEQLGTLSVGSWAEVNSYTDVSGREIATRISQRPVQMFLPLVLQRS